MPAIAPSLKSASIRFWTLAVFLCLVFLTGGASRVDEQALLLLRPLSVVTCAIALLTIKREHLEGRGWLLAGFVSIVLLCILHLIPLPPSLWQSLPGRGIVAEIDKLAGLGEVWRPLTLTPMNGWHALASLATPLAVLLLGVQLDKEDLYRLLPLLIGLAAISGLIGMLQAIGDPQGPLYFYRITNNGSAVGLFANRNHAAVLLACLFPMLAVYASISSGTVDQQRLRQFAAIAAGIVLVPLILVTGSRAGMLMSVPGLAAAVLLYRKPVEGRAVRRGEARFKLGAGHVIGAAAIVSLIFLTIFFSRAEAWDRLFEQSMAEEMRDDFWRVGAGMIWKYFPFGSGMGSFVEAYQLDEPFSYLNANYVNHAHNDWLEVALTGGLPAMLILATAILFYLKRTFALWRRNDPDRRAVKVARLASALIAIVALASIADYPLRTPTMMAVFALLCLWLTSPALDEQGRRASESRGD
ncbi:MAG: O-antigen ligase family protein [Sphingorhabdus sp.]